MSLTASLISSATSALGASHHQMPGPSADWEIIIAVISGYVVMIALGFALKMLIWPGEKSVDHIKRSILDDSAKHIKGEL